MDRKKMLIIGILVLVVGFFGWLLLGPSTPGNSPTSKVKAKSGYPKTRKINYV